MGKIFWLHINVLDIFSLIKLLNSLSLFLFTYFDMANRKKIFFNKFIYFIYLSLAVLGLRCCVWAFL